MSLEITDWDAFEDYCEVADLLVETWDVDPLYPLLEWIYDERGYDIETRHWYSMLFTCYYWMSTIETIFHRHPEPQYIHTDYTYNDEWNLKVRKERRCVYGKGNGCKHMNWIADREPSIHEWVQEKTQPGGQEGWKNFRNAYEEAPQAGGWASYKIADVLKYSHGYDITADDMGTGSGVEIRGPLAGIQLMTNLNDINEVEESINKQWEFYELATDHGVDFGGMEQMETCLCNYKSMTKGNYYVGCDIANMQRQIEGTEHEDQFWEARQELYPDYLLGENFGNYDGEQEHRMNLYRDKGIIRWWEHEDRTEGNGTTQDTFGSFA